MAVEAKSFVTSTELSGFSEMIPGDIVRYLVKCSQRSENPNASVELALAYYILAIKNPQGEILKKLTSTPKIFAEEIKRSGNENSVPKHIRNSGHKQDLEPTDSISLDLLILRRIRQNANLKEFWGQLKKHCSDVSPESLKALLIVIDGIE